jgi:signal transduction histidine kinase
MKLPKLTENEEQRLRALLDLNVLDTDPDQDLDLITELASSICETPIALISLIDSKRQWFKSKVGLEASETPRDYAFCAHAIQEPNNVFVVSDSRTDERFFDNPLVTGDPKVIFYCGVPIVTSDGHAIGTVCAIDNEPRKLTEFQVQSLRILAQMAGKLLQWKKESSFLGGQLSSMNKTLENSNAFFLKINEKGEISDIGEKWQKILPGLMVGAHFDDHFSLEDVDSFNELIASQKNFKLIYFKDRKFNRSFKSTLLTFSGTYVFMALPDVKAESPIGEYNLELSDFPENDFISEFMFLSELKLRELNETTELNKRISRQNVELKQALLKIDSMASFPDQNPNPVMRISRGQHIVYANQKARQLLGYFEIVDNLGSFPVLSNRTELLFSGQAELFREEIIEIQGNTYVFSLVYSKEHDFVNVYGFEITNYTNKIRQQQLDLQELNTHLEYKVAEETQKNLALNATLAESEKLVAIGELTMGIAHDLNSPIASIRFGAENIKETMEALFKGLIHDCTREELDFACSTALDINYKPFISGVRAMKEKTLLENYLKDVKQISGEEAVTLADGMIKAKIEHHETEFIDRILSSEHPDKFLTLLKDVHAIRQMMDTIIHAANRSADVVSDLRKFTKSAVNQSKEDINVRESVHSVLRVLSTNLMGNINIHVDVDSALIIHAIPRDLFQVWSNILKNAIEAFKTEDGDIWIRSEIQDNTLKIHFINNGPAIPEDVLPKIFERFKSSKGTENSGFGLNIVKRILAANGWDIDVTSDSELTKFTVIFP